MTTLAMVETADRQTDGLLLNKAMARVFSLRGAHLIGMFAPGLGAILAGRWRVGGRGALLSRTGRPSREEARSAQS